MAVALNAALAPARTVRFVGSLVIVGGTSTVSVATELVAVPTLLETMTRYAPASLVVMLASESELLFAPTGVLVLSDQK